MLPALQAAGARLTMHTTREPLHAIGEAYGTAASWCRICRLLIDEAAPRWCSVCQLSEECCTERWRLGLSPIQPPAYPLQRS